MADQEKKSFGSEFQLKEELDDEEIESNTIGSDPTEIITSVNPFNGYPVRQENGQRKTGPPPDWPTTRHPPSRGCEVFVGKLPRDCFEAELFPLFERCGAIYEMRLMMDFSGFNRGYAFITYQCRDDAKRSVKELNNFEIRPNRLIGVCQSVDNCRLFVGGIPKTKKREEILDEMCKISEGVVDVIVYPSAHDKTKNRGFAFVEYESHRSAAMARRKLLPGKIQLWGHQIAVDWAEPEAEVDEDVMATVRVLYVRNLMMTTTEEQIKEIFDKFKPNSVERVKKLKDYAFVHFRERDDALNAMNRMNGREIDGSIVEVTLAKPVDKNQYFRFTRGVSPSNIPFALSPNTATSLDLTAVPYLTIPSTLNTLTPKNVRRPVHLPSNLNGTVRSSAGSPGNLLHHRGAYYTILRPTARRSEEKCLEDLYKETYDALYGSAASHLTQPMMVIDQQQLTRPEQQTSQIIHQQQADEIPQLVPPGSLAFPPGTSLVPHPLLNTSPFVNGSYSNSSLLFANGPGPTPTFAYPIVFAPSYSTYPGLSAAPAPAPLTVDSTLFNYSSINSFGQSTFSN